MKCEDCKWQDECSFLENGNTEDCDGYYETDLAQVHGTDDLTKVFG